MYGLPGQSAAGVQATVEAAVAALDPERICLFGYAHVPWMKRHQRLIDESTLPPPAARFAQYMSAAEQLQDLGYVWIGLDHFAKPDDPLARAMRNGTLRRNFQGYTTDNAPARLGFGPSAIGTLPQGFVQNAVPLHAYRDAVLAAALPIVRGLRLSDDDRMVGTVIERLMCDLAVDVAAVAAAFGRPPTVFDAALADLGEMAADDLVTVEGSRVRVSEAGRPFVRAVCARFDRYLEPGASRHAHAV